MSEPTPIEIFEALLVALKKQKPNDRSEQDRYMAIVITDIEKAKAVYLQYVSTK